MNDWYHLQLFLEKITKNGERINFWWREDDVAGDFKNFERIVNLFLKYEIPAVAAVIPNQLCDRTITIIKRNKNLIVSQHGVSHIDRGQKQEFPENYNPSIALENILEKREILKNIFKNQFMPVYVPPWNNISKCLKILLLQNGFISISRHNYLGEQKKMNADIDLINWNVGKKFHSDEFVIKQILKELSAGNRHIGFVGHHQTIGDKGFDFIQQLFEETAKYNNISWVIPLEFIL